MAARTSAAVAADITAAVTFRFGGPSGKKRKMATVVIKGATSTSTVDTPWNIGADDGDFPVASFGFTKIEWCSNVMIYTTSGGGSLRIAAAAPSLAGTSVVLTDTGATAGAKTDMALAYTESAQITVVGY